MTSPSRRRGLDAQTSSLKALHLTTVRSSNEFTVGIYRQVSKSKEQAGKNVVLGPYTELFALGQVCDRPGCNLSYFRDHHRRRYCNLRCANTDRQYRSPSPIQSTMIRTMTTPHAAR